MSEQLKIEVQPREERGKNANRRLRAEGQVPAVLYGGDKDSVAIQVDRRIFLDGLRESGSENAVFLLKLAGDKSAARHAMIRDLQVDAVSRRVLHVDFQRVDMTQTVQVAVAIELQGVPDGVKNEGGILDFVTRELEVECLPGDIPAHLELDVSALIIGQHLEAKDVELPPSVALVDDPDRVIASVAHPRVIEEETEEDEDEALLEAERDEPEVIGRGKEEGEEDEG